MPHPLSLIGKPYGTRWRKWNGERKRSLHTALTLLCRTSFPCRRTSNLQGNFCWSSLWAGAWWWTSPFILPTKRMAAFPIRIFMSCVPSVPLSRTVGGAISSGGNMCWTNTASVFWTRQAIMCSTLFPRQIGESPKRWKHGGRHGLTFATPSLPKRA